MTSRAPYNTDYPGDNLDLFLDNNTASINVAYTEGDTYINGNFYTKIIEALPEALGGDTELNIGKTEDTTRINLGRLVPIPINVNNVPLSLKNVGTIGSETLVSGETLITGFPATFSTKGIKAGTGISFTASGTDITITNTSTAGGVTLTSDGGTSLVSDGTGPALAIYGLSAGTGITLGAVSGGAIPISSAVTLADSGLVTNHQTLLNSTTIPNFTTKGLNLASGTGVSNGLTITSNSTDITLGLPTTADVTLNSLTTGSSGNMGLTLTTGTTITGNVVPTVTSTNTIGTNLKTYLSSNINTMNTDMVVVKNTVSGFSTIITSAASAAQPLVLPAIQGINKSVLTNDGSGNTSWILPDVDSVPNQEYGLISSGDATTTQLICTRYYQVYANYPGTISNISVYVANIGTTSSIRVGIYRGLIDISLPSAVLVAQSNSVSITSEFRQNINVATNIIFGQNLTFTQGAAYIIAISITAPLDEQTCQFVSNTGNTINNYSYISNADLVVSGFGTNPSGALITPNNIATS